MDDDHVYRRTKEQRQNDDVPLLRCAHLILPYLEPAGLASISTTCKKLLELSRTITSRRISDASRNFENIRIPFLNFVDSKLYDYFIYTPVQTLPIAIQPWGDSQEEIPGGVRPDPFLFRVEGAVGCECENGCSVEFGCPCTEELPGRECGPSCRCGSGCGNRLSQTGVCVKVKVVNDRRKGWSLYADELIPKGKFVCEYAGELLSFDH